MPEDTSTYREYRGLAAAFVLCAVASLTLLANHPGGGAHSLADFIKAEARNQFIDELVHGGFIVNLSALIVCFVLFSRVLGAARVPVVIGLVAFCVGCGALMASMILDGFVIPAIAARFAGTDMTDNPLAAKTLLFLCGTLIRFLMPTGLLFQAGAMLSWSVVIVTERMLPRYVGFFGLAATFLLIVALLAAPAMMAEHIFLGGIVLQSIWYLALAALLFRRGSDVANH